MAINLFWEQVKLLCHDQGIHERTVHIELTATTGHLLFTKIDLILEGHCFCQNSLT